MGHDTGAPLAAHLAAHGGALGAAVPALSRCRRAVRRMRLRLMGGSSRCVRLAEVAAGGRWAWMEESCGRICRPQSDNAR